MRKYLNLASWVFLFLFLPLTVLILVSQNSLPGDLFYPLKRGMEGVVLAAASLNPRTKAMFHTELADRRFDEAEKLLLGSASTVGFEGFVSEVKTAHQSVVSVSDPTQKKELTRKLTLSINDYETRLTQVQTQVESTPQVGEQIPLPENQPPTSLPQTLKSPVANLTPTTVVENLPSPTLPLPTLPPIAPVSPENRKKIEETIVVVQKELKTIKKDLEEQGTEEGKPQNSSEERQKEQNTSPENEKIKRTIESTERKGRSEKD